MIISILSTMAVALLAVPSDQERLQGDWKLVLSAGDSNWLDPKLSYPFSITSFRGNERITDRVGDRDTFDRDTFVLHPERRPKAIELHSKDPKGRPTTRVGAYELDGDTLKICFRYATTDLPPDFTCTPGQGRMLWVLERVKPGVLPAPAPAVVAIADEHRAGDDPTEIRIALTNKTEEPIPVSFKRNYWHRTFFRFYLFDEQGRPANLTKIRTPDRIGGSTGVVRIKPGKTVTGYLSPKLDYEVPPGRYQVEVVYFYHVPGKGVLQECVSNRITMVFP